MEYTYDRASELKAFDDTKTGVKGLVDSGIKTVPRIFYDPPSSNKPVAPAEAQINFPIIDLNRVYEDPILRKKIVESVGKAAETGGFFQVINHGIDVSVLEEMKAGAIRFHEQDNAAKNEFYTRDRTKRVIYNSNFDLFSAPAANWRDSVYIEMAPDPPKPEDLPAVFRDILMDYSKQVMKLGRLLFELLSEAMGLKPNHLEEMGCVDGLAVLSHYYPACPQPELTMGATEHADNDFITVLLQDDIGGLQVFLQTQWIDVPPIPGALVINVGDLLQLISNDKFISSQHRVLANRVGPRVSVASFFGTNLPDTRLFGPIKELLSKENPPKYKTVTAREYVTYFRNKGLDGTSALSHYELKL